MKRAAPSSTLRHNETFMQVSREGKHTSAVRLRIDDRVSARQIEMIPLSSLKPTERNVRTHSKHQIEQLAGAMRAFGFINPIIVDGRRNIIAGHARASSAKLLGLKTVPTIAVTDLSETEIRAFMLADNKLAENSGWDRELLALELEALQTALPEIGLELDVTGFDPGEIDLLMGDFVESRSNPMDDIPEPEEIAIAKPGDLFVLGHHRIIVGDARDRGVYASLMGPEIAEMAFLDPPYNVKVNGHVGGRGQTKHREFAHASGEMTSSQFTQFLRETLGAAARSVKDGGIVYICMDWRHTPELLEAGAGVFDELKNICIWTKSNAGQGSFYRNQHEMVFVYKRGKARHINTFELGQHGRNRSNVWNYAGANSFRAGRMDELKMHPTVKPVALIADAMKDCSRRGSIILDSFAGSGSTVLAAEQVGRRAYCIEIDPKYVDVAIRRWQRATRKDAILESTGKAFDEICSVSIKSTKSGKENGNAKRSG
jgi:DNA modification methylase